MMNLFHHAWAPDALKLERAAHSLYLKINVAMLTRVSVQSAFRNTTWWKCFTKCHLTFYYDTIPNCI